MSNNKPDKQVQQAEEQHPLTMQQALLLLEHLHHLLEQIYATKAEWLTVDEVAAELKLSSSIIYRLIRKGKIEAVNVADTNENGQRGHYRISRESLQDYLEAKKVHAIPDTTSRKGRRSPLPKVKNYLGL